MGKFVSDAVWQQLDRNAGKLSPRGTRWMWIASGLSLVFVASFVAAWSVGLVVPKLGSSGSGSEVSQSGRIRLEVDLENEGIRPVTIAQAGGDGPGIDFLGVTGVPFLDTYDPSAPGGGRPTVQGELPQTLEPGDRITLTLTYRVTDCELAQSPEAMGSVRVQRFWGRQTAFSYSDSLASAIEIICDPESWKYQE